MPLVRGCEVSDDMEFSRDFLDAHYERMREVLRTTPAASVPGWLVGELVAAERRELLHREVEALERIADSLESIWSGARRS